MKTFGQTSMSAKDKQKTDWAGLISIHTGLSDLTWLKKVKERSLKTSMSAKDKKRNYYISICKVPCCYTYLS